LALKLPHLELRDLLTNIAIISRAFDDHDDISPCGISLNDILGISRADLVQYFTRM
jgi:hypothetical protein